MIKELYGVTIRDVAKKDAQRLAAEVAANMRREDREESFLFGLEPERNVLLSILASDVVYTMWADTLLGVFGLADDGVPIIWFLGTEEVKKHKKALVAMGYSFIEDMVDRYGFVMNCISLVNVPAIRYIKGVTRAGLLCETRNTDNVMAFIIRRDVCAESRGS